jgi:hypothetical protein
MSPDGGPPPPTAKRPGPDAPRAPTNEDDTVADLPALDGGEGEDGDADVRGLDDTEVSEGLRDDGADPFDDSTGESAGGTLQGDAASELAGLDDETASLLDAGEADGLDVGAHDLVGGDEASEKLTDDGREEERLHDDYDLRDDAVHTALDAGEEGPMADDESLTDEGLPSLGDDDDDDAVQDAGAFFDGDLAGGLAARALAGRDDAWASQWERFGSPFSVPPARALACGGRGARSVLAAGRELVRIDLEGATERLAGRGLAGGEATRAVQAGDDLYVTTETGGLFVSRDRGATFSELPAWRDRVRPEEAAAGLDVTASADGALWGRTAQGGLLTSRDRGERWEKVDVDGFVRALGTDDAGRPVVFVRALGMSEVLRLAAESAASHAAWTRAKLPQELLGPAMDGQATIVAWGVAVAVAIEGEGVLRTLDGAQWSRVTGAATVTAMAMLDAAGALVVALPAPVGEPSVLRLARVGADGEAREAARWEERSEVGGSRDSVDGADGLDALEGEPHDLDGGEAGVTALVVDHAHQVVWAAGSFGVAAFQPKMRRGG